MGYENSYIKTNSKIPDKMSTKYLAIGALVLLDSFNLLFIYVLEHKLLIANTICMILKLLLVIFNLIGFTFCIWPAKLTKFIHLYVTIIYSGSSVFYLLIADYMMYLKLDNAKLLILYSILGYFLMILIQVFIVIRKIYGVNKVNYFPIGGLAGLPFIGGVLGTSLGRHTQLKDGIGLIIALLLLSYLMVFTNIGYFRTYLIFKKEKSKKIIRQN